MEDLPYMLEPESDLESEEYGDHQLVVGKTLFRNSVANTVTLQLYCDEDACFTCSNHEQTIRKTKTSSG